MEMVLPSFQIEKNVNSLLMLPLWGFDMLDPQHDFFGKRLSSSPLQVKTICLSSYIDL
jgi:hypothetical protein